MEFDFAQSTTVDSLEKVPADFRGLYEPSTADEGKFVLKSDEGVKSAVGVITRLNVSLKASRAEAKANKSQKIDLTPLADFGETPEAILINFSEKLDEAQNVAKATGNEEMSRQIEKIKQDLATVHSKEKDGYEKRNGALQGQLYQTLVRAASMNAMKEAGVVDPELFFALLEPSIKAGEVDGQYHVQVIDDQGDVRFSGTTGVEMSANERIQEMKSQDRFKPFFKSDAPSGGGTPPGAPSRTPVVKQGELTSAEKIASGLKKGQHTQATGRPA